MTMVRYVGSACLAAAMVLAASPARAQAPAADAQALRAEIDRLRRDLDALTTEYGERLTTLEQKLAALPGAPAETAATAPAPQPAATAPPSAPMPETTPPAGAPPVYGASTGSSKIFNPDMAVIGDFLGAGGPNRVNPGPALAMHESEASFQAAVDPYARADFFLSFGEEGVDLEEGFITFPTLPGGLLGRVGKMRAAFGKVNTLHNHAVPWTDRPLVTNNLVGGEEGITDAGISIARVIPNPWLFVEVTGQVFRGDTPDPLFTSSRRSDLSYVGHVRAYQDVTENGNIDVGASYARGRNPAGLVEGADVGRFTTELYGIDATFRWRPLARAIYHSFLGRSEVVWSRRDQFDRRQQAMGYYVSGDYQFARRWFAGARVDRSGRADNAARLDTGQSLVLTYWPSEFSQVRGQYRRTAYADGPTANEFLFQFQFSIGAHGAHPF